MTEEAAAETPRRRVGERRRPISPTSAPAKTSRASARRSPESWREAMATATPAVDQAACSSSCAGGCRATPSRSWPATSRVRLVTIVLSSLLVAGVRVRRQPTTGSACSGIEQHPARAAGSSAPVRLAVLRARRSLLVFSTGIDPLRQPVHRRRSRVPARHAGPGRPGVRLQVPGGGRVQLVGFVLLGMPDPARLRARRSACPWYFYVLLPVFFLGFVLLPGSVGGAVPAC